MQKITYYNLTQTLGDRLVYLRSTDVEQKNYHRLLWSVPDEWLYLLSIGNEIEVIDKSSNKAGKIERIFIPVLVDLLNYLYYKKEPKNKNLINHFNLAVEAIKKDKNLYKKFVFWKKFQPKIKITAKTIQIDKEVNFYEYMMKKESPTMRAS